MGLFSGVDFHEVDPNRYGFQGVYQKQKDNTYILQAKTEEGWFNSQLGQFTFIDKKV